MCGRQDHWQPASFVSVHQFTSFTSFEFEMNGRDFLALARRLIAGATEAEWRTAVSRGITRRFMSRATCAKTWASMFQGGPAHKYLSFRLSNLW